MADAPAGLARRRTAAAGYKLERIMPVAGKCRDRAGDIGLMVLAGANGGLGRGAAHEMFLSRIRADVDPHHLGTG